jgi:hypothetical protein
MQIMQNATAPIAASIAKTILYGSGIITSCVEWQYPF